ncbi:conserved oligomeric Golgi complex subunit 2 isoform X1 [Linepithema humile]|uniref:conserved oligomeric Golgi complex subunit 2 isoform X1 n=2 Tax=Linepithema humile TaxID=83485 RepID=UPI0006236D9F|nr:PREDICTED: conserved oligomeric Golgi complex subunit 2 isoform X1 [Linepithema humile]
MSNNNITLPKAPKELCFSELDFVQENFDVDTFLQDHRKNGKLETMRDDLGMYLKLLRSAMIDLINRDYADFVNLSSNLIGLDKAINDLQAPLGQLREEVLQVRQALDDEITAISTNLDENLKIRERKQSLYSLQHAYKSLKKLSSILSMETFMENPTKIDVLEQAAIELNQLKFHISRCKVDMSTDQEKESSKLESLYLTFLNELFLACIHEKNSNLMVRCLRIYLTLDKITIAEEQVKHEVLRPLIYNIVNEENLQTDPLGLQSIYHKLLNILNVELKQLLDITLYPDRISVKGFNFLVNSFWIEVEEKIEQYIKSIFAPGDPVLFHKRYTATLEFLIKLEAECVTPETLAALRNHPQYKSFLKKWNLPVYFQIRFQEIAGNVETILAEPVSPDSVKGSLTSLTQKDFSLHATCIVWDNLLRIWADDIYLYQLFHKFWKLSLQICSRYQTWCQNTMKQVWPVINETNSSSNSEHSTRLNFLVYLYTDVEKLINALPSFLQMVQLKIKDENVIISKLLKESLDETSKNLANLLPSVTKEIVNELSEQCVTYLKQVSDIPRLFRRTKRDVPTKPCPYIKSAMVPLTNFYTDYNKIIPETVIPWLELTLSSLTQNYLLFVTDVLTSVQKTEESLRRLKKIRDKSTGILPSEPQGTSDDEKIRIQLKVDVDGYVNMIKEFNITTTDIHHLQELIDAVEAAVKK